jgi:hypothetical protein
VRALLDELAAIVSLAGQRHITLAVIGACALRTYLPDPDTRKSVDADLVTTTADLPALTALLEERGYQVFSTGPWRRAERTNHERIVFDIAVDAIVDMRSFEPYAIDWKTVTERSALPVLAIEDLIAQKLIAAREKDLLDVLLVAAEPSINVDGARMRSAIEARDVEIAVMRGCLEAQGAVTSGRAAELWLERYGTKPAPKVLEDAALRVRKWLEVKS